jgi:hypothetical protein
MMLILLLERGAVAAPREDDHSRPFLFCTLQKHRRGAFSPFAGVRKKKPRKPYDFRGKSTGRLHVWET